MTERLHGSARWFARRRGFSLIVALVSAVGLACAQKGVVLDPTERSWLRGYAGILHAVRVPPPDFVMRTPGKAALGGGLLGAAVSEGLFHRQGEQLRERYALQDPAAAVLRHMVDHLRRDWAVRDIRSSEDSLGLEPAAPSGGAGNDLVLQVETTSWQLLYYPTDWSHYRLDYAVRARLVRPEPIGVIWEATCRHLEEEPEGRRTTRPELEADAANLLKRKMADAASICAQQMAARLSGHDDQASLVDDPQPVPDRPEFRADRSV